MTKGKPRWNPIRCPCCQESARLGRDYPPLSQEEILRSKAEPLVWSQPGWPLRCAKNRKLKWACLKCIGSGRALEAKPWLQTFLDFLPRFAYFDVRKRCDDCKQHFVFSASEQYRWYEQYKFWVQSEPKQCLSCRRLRRQRVEANKELVAALSELDPRDPLQLARISDLYLVIGSVRKAAEYLSRAKNRAGGVETLETQRKVHE